MKNLKSFLLFIFALYSFGASIVLCTLVNDNNLMGALAIISICIVSGIVSLNTMLTSK